MTPLVERPGSGAPEAVADPAATSPALRAFALQERVEAALRPRLVELLAQLPRLVARKAFSEGAYVLGVRTPAEVLSSSSDYSRVDLELVISAAEGTASVTCRTTTRGRDWPVERLPATVLDVAGLATLVGWCETCLLQFAERELEARLAARLARR